jgi:hypothetical protein
VRAGRRALAAALLTLGAAACHPDAPSADDLGAPLPDVSADARLVVDNRSAESVYVTVAHGFGPEARLGAVAAGATKTFVLGRDLWESGPIALVATPVSGFGMARSAPFDVFDGSTVTFTVESDLGRSHTTVTVR